MLAHAANNVINDYFDTTGGVDTDDYVRALYAPHPILSGWVTKRQLGIAILLVNAVGAAIMLYLAAVRGPLIIAFALAGLFISVFYVAPPIRLKHHGLGEPGVFITWGPLMVGGTFLAATGTIAPWVLLVSVPYALLVTSVLFGKHIDKIEADGALGVRTLPVILGETRARTVGRWLMIAVLPADDPVGRGRADRAVGAASRARGPAAPRRAKGVPISQSRRHRRRTIRRLAALVRRLRLRPHSPGRWIADARAAPQRTGADRPPLGISGHQKTGW